MQAQVLVQQLAAAAADNSAYNAFSITTALGAIVSMLASKDAEAYDCIVKSDGQSRVNQSDLNHGKVLA